MPFKRKLPHMIGEYNRKHEKGRTIGRVTKVYEKESDDMDEGNIEVNVQHPQKHNELRRVPLLQFDHPGHISVPKKDDFVIIDWMIGDGMEPIVTGVVQTNKNRSPHALEGHWRHEFRHDDHDKSLYLEAVPEQSDDAGDPEILRMGVKEDGISEPSTEVAIDESGDDTAVRIETDGDVTIEANGELTIDGSNGVTVNTDEGEKSVAYNDHTHDFDNSDGETRTTEEPNEDGTETLIG